MLLVVGWFVLSGFGVSEIQVNCRTGKNRAKKMLIGSDDNYGSEMLLCNSAFLMCSVRADERER